MLGGVNPPQDASQPDYHLHFGGEVNPPQSDQHNEHWGGLTPPGPGSTMSTYWEGIEKHWSKAWTNGIQKGLDSNLESPSLFEASKKKSPIFRNHSEEPALGGVNPPQSAE